MKKYTKYKPSGIEWIGEIPDSWDIAKIKNVALNVKTGTTPPTEERQYYEEGEIDWYSPSDLGNQLILKKASKKLNIIALKDGKIRLFKKHSILLVGIGATLGKIGILTHDASANQQINAIYFRNNFNAYYGLYFLKTITPVLKDFSSSSTLAILNQQETKDIVLPLPSKTEQSSIARFLDHKTALIDRITSNRRKQIDLLKEERKAVINKAVTKGINKNAKMKPSGIEWLGEIPEHWELNRFKYLFGLNTTKCLSNLIKIGLENIESGTGRFLTTDSEFEGDGIHFIKNDILFGKLRPYLAKVLLATFEGNAVGDFFVFRPTEKVNAHFGYYLILSSFFIEVTNSSTFGTKMPRVSWEFISNLQIAFPTLQKQEAIIAHIEEKTSKIDTLITKYEKQINLLEEYRTALISKAVTGQIDVREWQPETELELMS